MISRALFVSLFFVGAFGNLQASAAGEKEEGAHSGPLLVGMGWPYSHLAADARESQGIVFSSSSEEGSYEESADLLLRTVSNERVVIEKLAKMLADGEKGISAEDMKNIKRWLFKISKTERPKFAESIKEQRRTNTKKPLMDMLQEAVEKYNSASKAEPKKVELPEEQTREMQKELIAAVSGLDLSALGISGGGGS